jgi:hypothetical protein
VTFGYSPTVDFIRVATSSSSRSHLERCQMSGMACLARLTVENPPPPPVPAVPPPPAPHTFTVISETPAGTVNDCCPPVYENVCLTGGGSALATPNPNDNKHTAILMPSFGDLPLNLVPYLWQLIISPSSTLTTHGPRAQGSQDRYSSVTILAHMGDVDQGVASRRGAPTDGSYQA